MTSSAKLPDGLLPAGLAYEGVRVASHSKMGALIEYAVQQLATSSDAVLVLHSLPPPPPSALPNSAPVDAPAPSTSIDPAQPNKTSDSALTKLVSIAEIIKRAHAVSLDDPLSKGKGKGRAMEGLHQYTFIGALEELGPPSVEGEVEAGGEEKRMEAVTMSWLKSGRGGTKRPRRKHTPYMIVVLSKTPLEKLGRWKNFSHQPPDALSPPAAKTKSTKRADPPVAAAATADGIEKTAESEGQAEDGMAVDEPRKKPRRRRTKKKAGAGEGAEGPMASMEL